MAACLRTLRKTLSFLVYDRSQLKYEQSRVRLQVGAEGQTPDIAGGHSLHEYGAREILQ